MCSAVSSKGEMDIMRYCQILLGISAVAYLSDGVYCLLHPVQLAGKRL